MHSPCQSHSDEYHSGLARTATALQRDQAAQLIRPRYYPLPGLDYWLKTVRGILVKTLVR